MLHSLSFSVLKCQRTSKENLIRLDVIRKEEDEMTGSESAQDDRPRTKPLNYYSRPGSSYVLTEQTVKNELSSKSKVIKSMSKHYNHEMVSISECNSCSSIWGHSLRRKIKS